jgi:apolipoprotein N-acyltransferase
VISEWVRNWIFTGFPWLAVGYSQAPSSPLASIAPIAGVFGVSVAVTLSASLILLAFQSTYKRQALITLVILYSISGGLNLIQWSKPKGVPISVSILQGNIPQDIKWTQEVIIQTIRQYAEMASQSRNKLIILPETALPVAIDTSEAEVRKNAILEPFIKLASNHQKSILVVMIQLTQKRS